VKPLFRYAASGLRPRALFALLLWSIPETLPTAAFGFIVARALDDGFLGGRPWTGAAWLAGLLLAAAIGAFGTRGLYACLGATVESFRDRLVRHVICHALQTSVAGHADTGAVSRLARQVEIARDAYAGVILAVRGCLVTAIGVTAGLLALDPRLALIILPPFLLGLFAFIATLGFAAQRHRRAAEADERLAERVGQVAAAVPDLAGCGGEDRGAALVAAPIARLAAAERALAGAAALRAACFAIGGWLPLLAVLVAAPWLADRGLTAGALTGALLYVLTGLQPALTALVTGLGGSGLRLTVALSRILGDDKISASRSEPNPAPEHVRPSGTAEPVSAASAPEEGAAPAAAQSVSATSPSGRGTSTAAIARSESTGVITPPPAALTARGLTFAYGPHAAPAVAGLDLTVHEGDHLAIIGPSGIGKSTLAALLCCLLRPDSGTVTYGPVHEASAPEDTAPAAATDHVAPTETGPMSATPLTTAHLARLRVLLPQEAYVFTGTVRANLSYLNPVANDAELAAAASAVGAASLVERLGGLDASVDPQRLSAGQRQLLALARAYCSPAPIAVLDEATCHLDPAAESRAETAFAARGTLIVIAHRASSALRARRILILDGRTAAVGDQEHLRAVSPMYRKLLAHWGTDRTPELPEAPASRPPAVPAQIQPAS
jgi:ATP-binding cassette subfamily C protein